MKLQKKEGCKRCNKQIEIEDTVNDLCLRCMDIIEFGYQSFPAYELDSHKEDNKKLITV